MKPLYQSELPPGGEDFAGFGGMFRFTLDVFKHPNQPDDNQSDVSESQEW